MNLLQVKLILLPLILQAIPLDEDFAAPLQGWKIVTPDGFSGKVISLGGLLIEAAEGEHACVERPLRLDGSDERALVTEASRAAGKSSLKTVNRNAIFSLEKGGRSTAGRSGGAYV